MATITSTQTGLWSATSTWVGGVVPVDNDTVVIASGHEVTFDVDTSGFANGIAGITVTGTLSVSISTSSYLKMKAATYIGGAGTFNVGTSSTPIPFAVKFTLTGGSGWYVQGSGGLTMGVYGTEPSIKYAKLSGAESAGATRLEIDTDVTGDIWTVGDTIRIDNSTSRYSEQRTITAIASTYIDIDSGLTANKATDSFVTLCTRNVSVNGLGKEIFNNFADNKLVFGAGGVTSDGRHVFLLCFGMTVLGGVFYGNGEVVRVSYYSNILGGNFTGCGRFISVGNNLTISNVVVSGMDYGINGTCTIANCIATGNNRNLDGVIGEISNSYFGGSLYDMYYSSIKFHNTTLGSIIENSGYSAFSKSRYSESIDHNQTAGAFKAWTKGGITTSVDTPVPTGLTRSYQIALENATSEGFFKRHLNVPAGATISLTLYLRKSATMTYLPRAYVHTLDVEPITDATGVLHTFTMTDSVDTWESDTFEYENTADYDVAIDVTFVGMNATGYVYGQVADTFTGGGSGISRARLLGGV